jgi:ABC-type antimicrobial peptide transport system permease subunit
MALGADRSNVVKMVLKGAFWQVGVGLLVGIPAAIGAGKLIADQLFGVKAWDPVMLGAAVLLLGVAALVAAIIPAQRAAGLDPVVALRAE